jgi:hypothetical protein
MERTMHWAPVSDLHELGPLFIIERALKNELSFDHVDLARVRFAGCAVVGVHLGVRQPDSNIF